MKKFILSLFLLLIMLSIIVIKVSAYSPHYLPGGKNYISSDNVVKIGGYINTVSPFLIKPYTEYTFSMSRDYTEGIPYIYLNLYFYNNDTYISEENCDQETMTFDGVTNIWYYTFTTPVEANYIEFDFVDNGLHIPGTELVNVQLEEGNISTEYEPYIAGNIIDTSSPYFIGADTVISYFDQPITVLEIQSSLTAYDDIDGDLSSNITIVEDNYTANIGVLGLYSVVFSVTDNSMNSTQISVNVQVVDVLPPVFSNINSITAVYPNTYSVEDIISMLSASDNYDGDVSSQILLVEDGYTLNSSSVGTYQMEFEVSDSSGNISYYIQDILVVDNEGPVISGSSTINVGYNQLLSQATIKSGLSVIDNYDESSLLSLVIESDNYSDNYYKLGEYTIQFSVTDSSGNKTLKAVNIVVVDEIGPVVYFDSSIIQVYADTVLSLPDFADLLVKTNELSQGEDYFITIRYDTYSNHANRPGTYHMSLDFKDNLGKVLTKDFQIQVLERGYDYIYRPEDKLNNIQNNLVNYNALYAVGGVSLFTVSSGGVLFYHLMKRKNIFNALRRE